MIKISAAIRQAREALGLDQTTLAEAAGLDPGQLNAYESGIETVPGDVLWRLSEILGIPLEDLDSADELQREPTSRCRPRTVRASSISAAICSARR